MSSVNSAVLVDGRSVADENQLDTVTPDNDATQRN